MKCVCGAVRVGQLASARKRDRLLHSDHMRTSRKPTRLCHGRKRVRVGLGRVDGRRRGRGPQSPDIHLRCLPAGARGRRGSPRTLRQGPRAGPPCAARRTRYASTCSTHPCSRVHSPTLACACAPGLDQYGCIKLVNFIRCTTKSGADIAATLASLEPAQFADERFLIPVVPGDALLQYGRWAQTDGYAIHAHTHTHTHTHTHMHRVCGG